MASNASSCGPDYVAFGVSRLAAFDEQVSRAEGWLEAEQAEALEERLKSQEVCDGILAATEAAFHADRHAICEDALAAMDLGCGISSSAADPSEHIEGVAGSESWDAVLEDERLMRFSEAIGVPAGVLKRRDISALRAFVDNRCRACSRDGLLAKETGRARSAASTWVQTHSERVAKARAAAQATRERVRWRSVSPPV